MIGGIVGGFMSESILDDVEVLRDHNLAAVEARRAWAASIGELPAPELVLRTTTAWARTTR